MTDLSLEIDTSEIEALIKQFPALEQIIFDEIETTMRGSLPVLEEQIAGRTPVNTGALRSSIAPVIRGRSPRLEGLVGTSISYGWAVERGRPPGSMPPVDQIELWVRRKLGVTGSEARTTAFLIARAIERRGTRGAQMFEKGFEAAKGPIERLWRGLPGRAVAKMEKRLK
jgi:hypothetical protein